MGLTVKEVNDVRHKTKLQVCPRFWWFLFFMVVFSSEATEDQLCSLYINAPKFSKIKKNKLPLNYVCCRNLRDAGLVYQYDFQVFGTHLTWGVESLEHSCCPCWPGARWLTVADARSILSLVIWFVMKTNEEVIEAEVGNNKTKDTRRRAPGRDLARRGRVCWVTPHATN